ncbi:MAG: squalene/phytoene synthase family protein [Chloroflexi bacterium]|nr:squalene/phytoene synthase family protein [Chloroflexota bacterium]
MTTYLPNSWEYQLLAWAEQAQQTHRDPLKGEPAAELSSAYAYCAAVTRQHSRTFYLASALLPSEKRRAARALYAFCRVTDNIVDYPQGDPAANLETWRARLNASTGVANPVIVAWTDARTRFRNPERLWGSLIDGVKRDLTQNRYQTFSEVAEYAYGVASTVGLMSMHITGFSGEEANRMLSASVSRCKSPTSCATWRRIGKRGVCICLRTSLPTSDSPMPTSPRGASLTGGAALCDSRFGVTARSTPTRGAGLRCLTRTAGLRSRRLESCTTRSLPTSSATTTTYSAGVRTSA